MPTLHIRITGSPQAVVISGGRVQHINRITLKNYAISSAAAINSTSLLVNIDWLSIGMHDVNGAPGAHLLRLPFNYGTNFAANDMNLELEPLTQFVPQSFTVNVLDSAGVAFAPAAAYEINLFFDYTLQF